MDRFSLTHVLLLSCFVTMVASLSTVIKIKNVLPSNLPPVDVQCTSAGHKGPYKTLKTGDMYLFATVNNPVDDYVCWGYRGDYNIAFAGYDNTTDRGHPTVYWQLRVEGSFHSFDNSKFVKTDPWATNDKLF
ncbi:hypothetical protein ACFE04_014554 [Oxalis oulophora]